MTTFRDYDDFEDRMVAEHQNRKRQAADLERIRSYYRLEHRHGVRVSLGGRVRHHGREGSIVDTASQYLVVLHDGDDQPTRRHATSNMEYATTDGWVKATPKPDPFAAVPTEPAR